jgi:N-methylhydantoinase A/oxoprolinase/acetone carboxylase beta subunit
MANMRAAGERTISIGVDIGGTFTDVVLIEQGTRTIVSSKVLTTPAAPETAVLDAIELVLMQSGHSYAAVRTYVHGTTLATNAIIERKGACTGLLTTEGFRDSLETATELRYELYDPFIEFPEPLVPRYRRLGIPERTKFDGDVLTPVDGAALRSALDRMVNDGVESVAVCFLHAYANPENELLAGRAIEQAYPQLSVSLSSRVLPEIGEYARTSTTVANAYVRPLVARYLSDLVESLAGRGSLGAFFVMSSSGGTLSLDLAREFPVRLVESGPAAGVSIAAHYATELGKPDLLSFDMGGTTAKISLVQGGVPTRTNELEVARVRRFHKGSGLLLKAPAIDLIEIGAGGGSIAKVDALGLLAVGPQSAGADPGPVCYGRGGIEPTVTDADLVLGYLDAAHFLGGTMHLERDKALAAIEQHIGQPLGLDGHEAARSIFSVVNDSMANAAAVYAAEQGIDLRAYTLLAFGGAAPTHAWDVARRLGISEVRVPFAAGVLSALGCLASPVSFDFVFGYMRELEQVSWHEVNARFIELETEGRELLAQAGIEQGVVVSCSADMRYFGQRYEVKVALPAGPLDATLLPTLHEAFYATYRQHYGRDIREVPVETVSWRLNVSGPRPKLDIEWPSNARSGAPEPKGERDVFFLDHDHALPCLVYERVALAIGTELVGPVVVEDHESTSIVPPNATALIDEAQMLVIKLGGTTQ